MIGVHWRSSVFATISTPCACVPSTRPLPPSATLMRSLNDRIDRPASNRSKGQSMNNAHPHDKDASGDVRDGPLAGTRIIEFTQFAAGPYAASILGDFGADVVKVEQPSGDPFRHIDHIFGPGESGYFYGINRSKRSIVVDLRSDRGRQILDGLTQWTDVALVGFRPDAVESLGLNYENMKMRNEQLIYCSLTAFGESGPRANEAGMDLVVQALSGVMGITGEPDGPPIKVGPPIADFTASFLICAGICAALLARERHGSGQKLTINLLDGQTAILANYITPYLKTKIPIRPVGGGHPQLVPYQVFPTSNGYIVVACLSDKFWKPLAHAVHLDDMANDQRLSTNAGRVAKREQVISRFTDQLATRTSEEWLAAISAAGVPCAPVWNLEEALNDPQLLYNHGLAELVHPQYGPYQVANNPIRFHGSATGPRGYAPRLGEHTTEILRALGFDDN